MGFNLYDNLSRKTWNEMKKTQVNKKIERGEKGKHTPMVAVGLKAILMLIISPFDIPPCNTSALLGCF